MVSSSTFRTASHPSATVAATTAPESFIRVYSPVGRLELTSDGRSITSLTIASGGRLPHDALVETPNRVLEKAASQLEGYFSGKRRRFSLPLSFHGTPFQRAVWERLTELAWGEVTTYGRLGTVTGRYAAGRAVGGAIRANPIPIIIPCHRVLGADGTVTGYSGGDGIPTKLWLLAHEGVLLTGA